MKSKNVEFVDLFDPDVIGDGPSAAGYTKAGVPYRFAALIYGTKRADVGYAINGVDVSSLWAMKGSAVYVSSSAVPGSLTDSQVGGPPSVTSTVGFSYHRDGTTTFFPGVVYSDTWKIPTGATVGDDYDIRFTQTSGNAGGTLTATLNTWMQLNATRSVTLSVTKTTSGSMTVHRTLLIEIRRRSDGVVLASQSVYLEAQADIS